MNKQTIERLVHAVLIESEEARSDDFILLYEVYSHIQPFIGGMQFKDICRRHRQLGLPSVHSISRVRRMVFAKYPELKPKDTEPRELEEIEFIEYVRGEQHDRK